MISSQPRYDHFDISPYSKVYGLLRRPLLARRKGLEPPTYWFVASHSIQLS